MQIRVDRFLAITAMLASTAVVAAGCVSEEDNTGSGGTSGSGGSGAKGGSAGSTAGAAGSTAGSAGSGATGGESGTAGAGGGTAGAGGDAGVECLGDTPVNADAGTEYDFCASLPYISATCGDGGTGSPVGVDVCYYLNDYGRPGFTEAFASCLEAINVADPCGAEHYAAVQNCINTWWPEACTTGPIPVEGGTYDLCDDLVNGTDPCTEITVDECLADISPFSFDGQLYVGECYNASTTGTCKERFENCVMPY